jgi:type I restriction enzyme S subunit
MVIIRNKGGDINFDFYTNYLQSNVFQRQVERIAYGSAQPQLSVKVIKNMYVLEFDEVEQKEIVAIMKSENMKIELQKKRKENLERIKQGLMNDLLTGKRRVKII